MRRYNFGAVVMLALAFAGTVAAQEYSVRAYGAAEGLQNVWSSFRWFKTAQATSGLGPKAASTAMTASVSG